MGYNASDNGTYNLSGTGRLSGEPEHIGYSGTGTFNQSAGTNSAAFELGSNAGAVGTYNLSETGTVTAGYYEKIGVLGTGVFNQSGGTNNFSNWGWALYLGYNAGGNGTYNLTGGQLTTPNCPDYIGYSGIGAVVQSGGTNMPKASISATVPAQRDLQAQRQRAVVRGP